MVKRLLLAALFLSLAASTVFSANAELPNPLKTARAGQWVTYDIVIMGMEAQQKQTITEITGAGDDRVLTMKIEIMVDGEVVQSDEQQVVYKDAVAEQAASFDGGEEVTIEPTRFEVKGQQVDGVVVTFMEDDVKCQLYLSEAIPVVGIYRMDVEGMGDSIMSLNDFEM